MKKIWLIVCAIFILTLNISFAATIEGTAYDYELNPIENVMIEIDTTPAQQFLSKDGEYSFEVPMGSYTLTATKSDVNSIEILTVENDGTFIFDLFLFSSFSDDEDLLSAIDEIDLEDTSSTSPLWWISLIVVLILIGTVFIFRYKIFKLFRKKSKDNEAVEDSSDSMESFNSVKREKEENTKETSISLLRALAVIKRHDGRITQKDLRKDMMDLSEAKVSLILTELEANGTIKKIKKGRGNVILLNK